MRDTIITCDHCGVEIANSVITTTVAIKIYDPKVESFYHDLCKYCTVLLKEWMHT